MTTFIRHAFAIVSILIMVSLPLAISSACSQSTPEAREDSTKVGLWLRSIAIDAGYAVFIASITASVDVDIIRFPSKSSSTLGLRFSIDWYEAGGYGGPAEGSPFLDYDFLARHTISGNILRADFYVGLAYYTKTNPLNHPASWGVKGGFELRIKFLEHFFGALVRVSRPAGVGMYAGWDN